MTSNFGYTHGLRRILHRVRLPRMLVAFPTYPIPCKGRLSGYPQKSFRIILYQPTLPLLKCGLSLVACCYSSFNLPPALRAVRLR